MKDILGKIFGGTGASIADKISGIIDRHSFSKEEKAQFQKEMDQIWIQAEADMQKNVTERWALDSQAHSSFLAKNVRPIVLLILVISTILMVFIDAGWISFDLKESHTDLLQIVLFYLALNLSTLYFYQHLH